MRFSLIILLSLAVLALALATAHVQARRMSREEMRAAVQDLDEMGFFEVEDEEEEDFAEAQVVLPHTDVLSTFMYDPTKAQINTPLGTQMLGKKKTVTVSAGQVKIKNEGYGSKTFTLNGATVTMAVDQKNTFGRTTSTWVHLALNAPQHGRSHLFFIFSTGVTVGQAVTDMRDALVLGGAVNGGYETKP
eukprot:EC794388.1.p2 GENE.EC794388.1~~EC794388.1.p2  ORF type:complete len:190 (+),score=62.16 EC794388.1:34-603(+)